MWIAKKMLLKLKNFYAKNKVNKDGIRMEIK